MRAIALILLSIPAVAAAKPELVCPLVGGGLIQIDGPLDDWPPMRMLTKSAADARDAALSLRCAYDDKTLYVAVDVTDDRLIRKKGGAQDTLILSFADTRLEVLPSSAEAHARLVVRWLDRVRSARVLPSVADSLQKHGWSVELALPLVNVPGWAKGVPSIPFSVTHSDADRLIQGRTEDVVTTGPVLLTFEAAARTLKSFLEEQHLRPSDIRLDTLADMDGEPGVERVLVAGKVLGVLSDGYMYLTLPIASPRDLLGVDIVDLQGTGKASAIVRYREYGNGGSRDVLAIWNVHGGGFTRTFAHEIGKQLGTGRITDRWMLVPRKDRHGRDLVIQPGEAIGLSAATWNEAPAADMVPILLPWGDKKQEVWHFADDEVSGG